MYCLVWHCGAYSSTQCPKFGSSCWNDFFSTLSRRISLFEKSNICYQCCLLFLVTITGSDYYFVSNGHWYFKKYGVLRSMQRIRMSLFVDFNWLFLTCILKFDNFSSSFFKVVFLEDNELDCSHLVLTCKSALCRGCIESGICHFVPSVRNSLTFNLNIEDLLLCLFLRWFLEGYWLDDDDYKLHFLNPAIWGTCGVAVTWCFILSTQIFLSCFSFENFLPASFLDFNFSINTGGIATILCFLGSPQC